MFEGARYAWNEIKFYESIKKIQVMLEYASYDGKDKDRLRSLCSNAINAGENILELNKLEGILTRDEITTRMIAIDLIAKLSLTSEFSNSFSQQKKDFRQKLKQSIKEIYQCNITLMRA